MVEHRTGQPKPIEPGPIHLGKRPSLITRIAQILRHREITRDASNQARSEIDAKMNKFKGPNDHFGPDIA